MLLKIDVAVPFKSKVEFENGCLFLVTVTGLDNVLVSVAAVLSTILAVTLKPKVSRPCCFPVCFSQPPFGTGIFFLSLCLQPPSKKKKCTSSFWLRRILCIREMIKAAPNMQLSVFCSLLSPPWCNFFSPGLQLLPHFFSLLHFQQLYLCRVIVQTCDRVGEHRELSAAIRAATHCLGVMVPCRRQLLLMWGSRHIFVFWIETHPSITHTVTTLLQTSCHTLLNLLHAFGN